MTAPLRLSAVTDQPLAGILEGVRRAVVQACGGVDDMRLLGDKSLVLHAELRPGAIDAMRRSFEALQLSCDPECWQEADDADESARRAFTLRVQTSADGADGRSFVPPVPG